MIKVFIVHMKKIASLVIQNVPREDSDQTANVQADLNLCLVQTYPKICFLMLCLIRVW